MINETMQSCCVPRQVVEDFGDLHLRAWEALAAEEGKSVPPRWMLRRAEGMKNEQARCQPDASLT